MLRQKAPLLLVAMWCMIVAIGLAQAALNATEPPVWDALSYVQKGFTFWQAVAQGHLFNPFNLPMTVRPPGTVLMSYPLGWSPHFQWFYFRSSFIPIVLLIAALCICAKPRDLTQRGRWVLAALSLAAAGMPILYQFQANDIMPSSVNWGLVDSFIAGIAALAAAAVSRSVTRRSRGWATLAAIAGAFCVLIKPAGFIVMGLTGLSWLILLGFALGWNIRRLTANPTERRYAVTGLAVALPIFCVTALAALRSDYFSADNVAFGLRVLGFFGTEFTTALNLGTVAHLTRISFGDVVPVVILIGLVVAARATRGPALAALACILIGGWFWLFETDASQIRYFLPFGMMAFLLLTPPLLAAAERTRPTIVYGAVTVAVAPTLLITALLLMPSPPDAWQRALGVNLHTNDFGAENAQADAFLHARESEGAARPSMYFVDVSPPLRNIQAVFDYASITSNRRRGVDIRIPVNWQYATTTNFEDVLRSDFIAFELTRDKSLHDIANFTEEARVVSAWLSGLTEADGVTVVSDTRVRILQLIDRARFEAGFARMVATHTWPKSFYGANPRRWWSEADLAARITMEKRALHATGSPDPLVYLRGAESAVMAGGGLELNLWLDIAAPEKLGANWRIFAHVVDDKGNILANAESWVPTTPGPAPDESIRYFRIAYPARPPAAAAIAFGLLRVKGADTEFLSIDEGARDWDGRRIIVPLPASR